MGIKFPPRLLPETVKEPDSLRILGIGIIFFTLGKVKNDQKTFTESYILNSEEFYLYVKPKFL